jgi:hypothetical protein
MVGLDAVGPMKTTPNGNRYMLVCVDYLTRWPIAAPCKDITAKSAEKFLLNNVFQHFGIPTYLLTDRGTSFKAEYLDHVLKSLECKHLITTAYRPQSNGMVERLNQTLVQTISKIRRDSNVKKPWDSYISSALWYIRTMVNDSTGFSPSMLLYGFELRTPALWIPPTEGTIFTNTEDLIKSRTLYIENILKEVQQEAVTNSMGKKKKMKERYDKDVIERKQYEIGDKVLMKNHVPRSKFDEKWLGPMEIVKINKNSTYYLMDINARRIEEPVNGNYLVPYKQSLD